MVTEEGTETRALETGTTVLQGPMMQQQEQHIGVAGGGGGGVVVLLYNGKPNEALDALRYIRFCKKVSCQTLHGQPQDWKGCASRLVPEEWG